MNLSELFNTDDLDWLIKLIEEKEKRASVLSKEVPAFLLEMTREISGASKRDFDKMLKKQDMKGADNKEQCALMKAKMYQAKRQINLESELKEV